MGRSWDHSIRMLAEDERTFAGGPRPCTARGCAEPSLYAGGYLYVTGQRGRVSRAERTLCAVHADAFARRHGLDLPTLPSDRPRGRVGIGPEGRSS